MTSRRTVQAQLRLFIDRVEGLIEMRPIQEGTIKADWSLSYKAGGHLQSSIDIGDADHFRSVLLCFRRFVANDSEAQFFRIAKAVETTVDHTECRANFRDLRQAWVSAMVGSLGLVIEDTPFRSQEAFDMVTNAYLFHDDAAKEAAFDAFPVVVQDMIEIKLANLVIDCIRILWQARNNLKMALDGTT